MLVRKSSSAAGAGSRKLDKGFDERLDVRMVANDARINVAAAERLTWDEICKRYPNEWVVLVQFDSPGDEMDLEFKTAVVIARHKTRKGASRDVKAAFQHHDEVGSFWTGKIVAPISRFVLP